MEEEELAELRKQQREFEELRNAEKVEQQRLEEQERRLREEKVRNWKGLIMFIILFTLNNRVTIFNRIIIFNSKDAWNKLRTFSG